jgi:polysaccharide export outer membrane protein
MRAAEGGEGKEEVLRVGEGEVSFDTPIMRGDTVYVPKAGVFYVTGEVKKAGAYAFEVGTTLFKAITVAGGFTDKAAKGRIHVLRVVDGEEQKIKKIKLNTLVEPGDVVVVPESFF